MAASTTAIILAAGVGSRLRPFTDDRPKCLVPIGSTTILDRALDQLVAAGVDEFVLSAGYREDRLREAVARRGVPVRIVSNPDFATTQNVVSLVRALDAIPDPRRVIKLDGDVLFDRTLVQALLDADGTRVTVDRSATLGAEEMKVRVEGGRIVAFGKGLEPARSHGESIGVECFAAEDLPTIAAALRTAVRAGRTDVYYEDVYNDVLARVPFRAHFVEATDWMEVDDAADLAQARARFA